MDDCPHQKFTQRTTRWTGPSCNNAYIEGPSLDRGQLVFASLRLIWISRINTSQNLIAVIYWSNDAEGCRSPACLLSKPRCQVSYVMHIIQAVVAKRI